jgi:tRNA dimethylallyltransferase
MQHLYLGLAEKTQRQILESFDKSKRVIIIAGPTCAGKSKFSIFLAKALNGEIISADSMQVYRGMDIGTAKATAQQQAEIPHHLIDTRDITEPLNVVDFYYESRKCCESIIARDRVPIIVGGAGFYLHSLIYGPPSGPPSMPEVRERIEEEMEREGPDALFAKLMQEDPIYAKSITKHDKQKIIRALEIIAVSGKKVSDIDWKGKHKPLNYDFRCWFLYRPREILYKRIEKRCDHMLEAGFLDEVRRLEKLGLRSNNSAAQAIGYRQALEYLDSPQSQEDYVRFVNQFKQASRNYAKRQRTWFAKEPLFHWVDLDLHDPEVVMDMIAQDYLSR